MNVVVSIPDKFVPAPDADMSREMLEAFAIENYRRERLSLGQVAELLGLSIDEANAFLKRHCVPLTFGLDDLDEDEKSVELFLEQ